MDESISSTIISEYRTHEKDTGSTEVQVALLSSRILHLTSHLREHKHDKASRRGLIALVNQRRKLLVYLRRKDTDRYVGLIKSLNLKDVGAKA